MGIIVNTHLKTRIFKNFLHLPGIEPRFIDWSHTVWMSWTLLTHKNQTAELILMVGINMDHRI